MFFLTASLRKVVFSANVIKGQSDSPETNAMVAVFWLAAAQRQSDYVSHRVDSGANLADGPTRPDKDGCDLLAQLDAIEFESYFPGWLVNLWAPFASDVLCQDAIALADD